MWRDSRGVSEAWRSRDGHLAIASVYLDDSLPAGLYLCEFGGQDGLHACDFWGRRSYNCHCVLFHPREQATLYAVIEPDGFLNGIWRSRDFGQSWEHLTKGLPTGDQFRRVSLAFAPSDPQVMYAVAANRRNHVLGVFRSGDGGDSWREILGDRYPRERQQSYNNTVAVHPTNPNSIVWGGMQLYRTDDAGRNWRRITGKPREARNYVHPDHHAILWPDPETIISGNDGGVAITTDGGRVWQDRSAGMVTTMFYDLDIAAQDSNIVGGGTQDNGTLIRGVAGVKDNDFVSAIPGDGAWVVFDPANAGNVFACASDFLVFRHRAGDPWDFDHWKSIRPRQVSEEESEQRVFTVMAIEPSTRRGSKTLGPEPVVCGAPG